jgi:putative membrane protein
VFKSLEASKISRGGETQSTVTQGERSILMRSKAIHWIWAGAFSSLALVVNAATPPAWTVPSEPASPPSSYDYNTPARDPNRPANYVQAGQLNGGRLNSYDYNFLVHAGLLGLEQELAGEIAQRRSTSMSVRKAGERMLNDEGQAMTGLREIATRKGAVMPTQLQRPERALVLPLETLPAPEFDKTFTRVTVKRETRAVKQFEVAWKNISDPDLRAWAQNTIPLLQERLQMSENMEVAVQNAQ